ncbi:unnamed protein product [Chrysoparadoxa australica]
MSFSEQPTSDGVPGAPATPESPRRRQNSVGSRGSVMNWMSFDSDEEGTPGRRKELDLVDDTMNPAVAVAMRHVNSGTGAAAGGIASAGSAKRGPVRGSVNVRSLNFSKPPAVPRIKEEAVPIEDEEGERMRKEEEAHSWRPDAPAAKGSFSSSNGDSGSSFGGMDPGSPADPALVERFRALLPGGRSPETSEADMSVGLRGPLFSDITGTSGSPNGSSCNVSLGFEPGEVELVQEVELGEIAEEIKNFTPFLGETPEKKLPPPSQISKGVGAGVTNPRAAGAKPPVFRMVNVRNTLSTPDKPVASTPEKKKPRGPTVNVRQTRCTPEQPPSTNPFLEDSGSGFCVDTSAEDSVSSLVVSESDADSLAPPPPPPIASEVDGNALSAAPDKPPSPLATSQPAPTAASAVTPETEEACSDSESATTTGSVGLRSPSGSISEKPTPTPSVAQHTLGDVGSLSGSECSAAGSGTTEGSVGGVRTPSGSISEKPMSVGPVDELGSIAGSEPEQRGNTARQVTPTKAAKGPSSSPAGSTSRSRVRGRGRAPPVSAEATEPRDRDGVTLCCKFQVMVGKSTVLVIGDLEDLGAAFLEGVRAKMRQRQGVRYSKASVGWLYNMTQRREIALDEMLSCSVHPGDAVRAYALGELPAGKGSSGAAVASARGAGAADMLGLEVSELREAVATGVLNKTRGSRGSASGALDATLSGGHSPRRKSPSKHNTPLSLVEASCQEGIGLDPQEFDEILQSELEKNRAWQQHNREVIMRRESVKEQRAREYEANVARYEREAAEQELLISRKEMSKQLDLANKAREGALRSAMILGQAKQMQDLSASTRAHQLTLKEEEIASSARKRQQLREEILRKGLLRQEHRDLVFEDHMGTIAANSEINEIMMEEPRSVMREAQLAGDKDLEKKAKWVLLQKQAKVRAAIKKEAVEILRRRRQEQRYQEAGAEAARQRKAEQLAGGMSPGPGAYIKP